MEETGPETIRLAENTACPRPPAPFRKQEFKDRTKENAIYVANGAGPRICRLKLGRPERGYSTIYAQGLDYQVALEQAVCRRYPTEGVNEYAATLIGAACFSLMTQKIISAKLRKYSKDMSFADQASYLEKAAKEYRNCCKMVEKLGIATMEIESDPFEQAKRIKATIIK